MKTTSAANCRTLNTSPPSGSPRYAVRFGAVRRAGGPPAIAIPFFGTAGGRPAVFDLLALRVPAESGYLGATQVPLPFQGLREAYPSNGRGDVRLRPH